MHRIRFWLKLRPRPLYSALPDTLLDFKGPTSNKKKREKKETYKKQEVDKKEKRKKRKGDERKKKKKETPNNSHFWLRHWMEEMRRIDLPWRCYWLYRSA